MPYEVIRYIHLPQRCILPPSSLSVGEVRGYEGDRQLLIWVKAQFKKEDFFMQVLIDTGAEANLVRRGLLPARYLQKARNPISLLTADGTHMAGGSKETSLCLCLRTHTEEGQEEGQWCCETSFHEAEIGVDAILSYPWLKGLKVGVFLHIKALVR